MAPVTNDNNKIEDMKTIIQRALIVVVVLAVPSFFVHPFGRVKGERSRNPVFAGAQIDPPTLSIVQRSCVSCHSEQTSWPWYSYVPPASWMVEKDVRDGREQFNMSHWDEYSADKCMQILSEISVMVRNKQMPLPRYTWLHAEAKLIDADISVIDRWSHAERRRLRAEGVPQGDN